jgi:hypothetical protein
MLVAPEFKAYALEGFGEVLPPRKSFVTVRQRGLGAVTDGAFKMVVGDVE